MTRYIVTGVLIALFAALLAYVKFYEKGEAPKEGEEKTISALSIKKENIRRLEWSYPDGEIACVREGKRWRFETPAGARLDQGKLGAVLDAVAEFEATREIKGGAKPADYGLDRPAFKLEIGLAVGKNAAIIAGDETPTGEKTYIGIGGRTLIADTWRVEQLRKKADDLRDRSVIQFDREKVVALTAAGGGAAARCVKDKKGAWRLDGRKKSCESEASAVLSTLKYAEVEEFSAPDKAGKTTLGPEKEISVLKLEMAGNTEKIVEIGKPTGEDLYVFNADRKEIYKISATLAKDIAQLLQLAGENDESQKGE